MDLCIEDKEEMILRMKLLYIFVDLLVPIGSLVWEHLFLRLDGIWALNLDLQLAW